MGQEFDRGGELGTVGERIIALLGQEAGFSLNGSDCWAIGEAGNLRMKISQPEKVMAVFKNRLDGRRCFLLGSEELAESGELGVVLAVFRNKKGEWLTTFLPIMSGLVARYVKFDDLYFNLEISFLNEDDGGDWKMVNVDEKLERKLKPKERVRPWRRLKRLIFARA